MSADSPTPLQPLSRRALQLAVALSLLLIAVVANSLLRSGDESPFNPNPVAAAAEKTQEVPGMRVTLTMQISTESAPPVTIAGDGAYNGADNLAEFAYRTTSSQGAPMEFDALLGEDAWYFRYPQLVNKMPAGQEWIKLEGLPGQSEMSKVGDSPQSSLQILAGAGSVQRLGQVQVRGVATTHYRATLTAPGVVSALRAEGKDELADEFESIAPQLTGPMEAEVFIDQGGMLRRMNTVTSLVTEGKVVTTKVHSDLFDFGIHPSIQLPADSQVLDLGPALEEKLETAVS